MNLRLAYRKMEESVLRVKLGTKAFREDSVENELNCSRPSGHTTHIYRPLNGSMASANLI